MIELEAAALHTLRRWPRRRGRSDQQIAPIQPQQMSVWRAR